jgi:sortase (surface protein transpeptidase)
VDDNDLSVLKTHNHEQLVLQACHPRFFASERYLVYATPVSVTRRD